MKNFIIVSGSANSGKTSTTNLVIKKLLNNNYLLLDCDKEGFWETTKGGRVVLEKDGKEYLIITYGDSEESVKDIFENIDYNEYYSVVCCSRATWGRPVFHYFHKLVESFDLDKVNVIPIHKNFIAYSKRNDKENEMLSNLIYKLINLE